MNRATEVGELNIRLNVFQRLIKWLFSRFIYDWEDILNIPLGTEVYIGPRSVKLKTRGRFDKRGRWVNGQSGYVFDGDAYKGKIHR